MSGEMEIQKNIMPTIEYQPNTHSKTKKKEESKNMSVDEYIALVREALDERYENIQG